jgi:hypothetical protein
MGAGRHACFKNAEGESREIVCQIINYNYSTEVEFKVLLCYYIIIMIIQIIQGDLIYITSKIEQ